MVVRCSVIPDLRVKKIPEVLRARLEAEARRSFRSINAEILYRGERSFNADGARISAIHAKWVYEALNSGDAKPLFDADVDRAVNTGVKRAKARKLATV
jgi:hypothetical protein